MDIPFVSSSAMNRSQYALVRKVENAGSLQAVDEILFAEINAIRGRLRKSSLVRPRALAGDSLSNIPQKECKESLVILLYCAMTSTSTIVDLDLSFALSYAINLAEAGASVQDKRIGM